MSVIISPFLRKALIADAVVSGAAALLMAFAADFVAGLTALPAPLLVWTGGVLLPFVALLAITARRETASKALIGFIILANAAWVVASLALLFGTLSPNMLGYAFVIGQALAVAVFAQWQNIGLRQAPVAA